jgi:predicted nuclease with TOPRIM domain
MEALEMERPMTEWNDDRLDELNGRMKEGFADVDKRFEQVDKRFEQVDKRFEQVDKRFEQVDERFIRLEGEMKQGFAYADKRMEAGFERINDRLDRLYQLLLVSAVGVIGTLVANGIWG